MKIKYALMILISFTMFACSGENVKKRNDEEIDNKSASATNLQLGVGYIKRNQYEIAREKLEKSIEQDPTNVEAHTTMAYLLMVLNELDKVEGYYKHALDIKPNSPETLNSYGTFLCKVKRYKEAMDNFRKAYSNPFYNTQYLAYSNAGNCMLEAKQYDQAEFLLRKALKQQPQMASALISMAEVGLKTKKYLMARAYAQRFHAVSKPTPESLWVQSMAERGLGDQRHYLKYAKQLLDEFPDSKQASWIDKLAERDANKRN